MTDEQIAAFVNAKAAITLAITQGMMAENARAAWQTDGAEQAHASGEFFAVADEMESVLESFNMGADDTADNSVSEAYPHWDTMTPMQKDEAIKKAI